MADLSKVLTAVDDGLEASLARLFELLRIPSVSTDPAHADDCRRAGQWLVDKLAGLGFDADLRDTAGHPMVVAHYAPRNTRNNAPHVLFYGHYDVQPADPLEEWKSPPFEPRREKGTDGVERIFARGAVDDKGQLMTFLEASRAWIENTGDLPLKVTVLLEGEEESGSPSLLPFLKANRKELACDLALVCDTGMWDAKTPAITTRLRGMAHEEVVITGPVVDLHSGMFGGPAINPIRVLNRILADMHDKNGRVTIPGFYDGAPVLSRSTRRQWDALKFSARKFLGGVGLKIAAGEKRYSPLEQIWSRPTAEVNGIIGGYTGPGTKTVIPSKASAKISFRLVGNQAPDKIKKAFRTFVRQRVPKDCKVDFLQAGHGSPAIEIAEDNPYLTQVARALKDEFRKSPVMMGCGGSIPIVGSFKDMLKMESLLVGFALDDDAMHSPNEKYNVENFHRGTRSWARIIAALAN